MNALLFSADALAREVRRATRVRQLGSDPTCKRCGESDPIALSLARHDGQVLCLRCAARLDRRPVARPVRRLCLACSFMPGAGDEHTIELHHVLGRANHASLVVPLCLNCHAKMTDSQRSAEMDLSEFEPRTAHLIEATGIGLGLALLAAQESAGKGRWVRVGNVFFSAVVAARGALEVANGIA